MSNDCIPRNVSQLIKKHRTNDPFELASALGILVIYAPLGDMLGYYNTFNRIHMIHINSDADHEDQVFTCAHEIGHRILHPGVNTPFLRRHTRFPVGRIEREANEFATHLLIGDEKPDQDESIEWFMKRCGIPEDMFEYLESKYN